MLYPVGWVNNTNIFIALINILYNVAVPILAHRQSKHHLQRIVYQLNERYEPKVTPVPTTLILIFERQSSNSPPIYRAVWTPNKLRPYASVSKVENHNASCFRSFSAVTERTSLVCTVGDKSSQTVSKCFCCQLYNANDKFVRVYNISLQKTISGRLIEVLLPNLLN